jgi:hypothetical protein
MAADVRQRAETIQLGLEEELGGVERLRQGAGAASESARASEEPTHFIKGSSVVWPGRRAADAAFICLGHDGDRIG